VSLFVIEVLCETGRGVTVIEGRSGGVIEGEMEEEGIVIRCVGKKG
jgi:hypothetical protein